MSLEYSCFISYRRQGFDKKYLKKLKKILQNETYKVTNRKHAFFDDESIRYGENFSPAIFSSIEQSYFFIPLWYFNYLHEDNIFCAKELLHALNIEEKVKSLLPDSEKEKFSLIIPLLLRGQETDLPKCFSQKQVVNLKKYENLIMQSVEPISLTILRQKLYDDLFFYFKTREKYIDKDTYNELYMSIERPDDSYVKEWIKDQRRAIIDKESQNKPILKKTDE